MRRLCVFCGSSPGIDPAYVEAASALGTLLGRRGIGLVYGGAKVGVMGAIADAALETGAEVIGIIPRSLVRKEVAHQGIGDLRIVETMHERKAQMAELADGFIALPGGCGTFEEFFEVVTWAQIGIHSKPCALLNVNGYYDPLVALFEHAIDQRFVRPEHRELVLIDTEAGRLLDRMESHRPPVVEKWMNRSQS